MAPNEDEVERQLTTLTGSSTGSFLPFLCHLRRSTVLLIPGARRRLYFCGSEARILWLRPVPDLLPEGRHDSAVGANAASGDPACADRP